MAHHPFLRASVALVGAALLASCSADIPSSDGSVSATDGLDAAASGFATTAVAEFDQPWAMTFLPDGDALVTEKGGTLQRVDVVDGSATEVAGVPDVVNAGQGGLGDVIVGPTFAEDRGIYLSWIERGPEGTGAVIGRATLGEPESKLENLTVIWRQDTTTGDGHFSHRMTISPDGQFLFVTSGERQKKDPAQDLSTNLGKVLRLNLDGTPAAGNPFSDRGGVAAQIWSYGHRNPLGIAFDESGQLWVSEMGPKGGDELNLILEGKNYGWPDASNGSDYSGADIPDHTAGDGFEAPAVWWTPSVSPGSLMIYSGDKFESWTGDAFLGALSGEALIRVDLDGTTAKLADQWEMGQRIREVEQDHDGSIWLLEDGTGGRLLRLTPP
ncbi:MAG: PQQ-dependent sugar dehydrogenase [Propionibacteriaceae bacterium]|nr:PQQ-dependent sugar dehydrogenase [Propionibacteriaceae bacterium]